LVFRAGVPATRERPAGDLPGQATGPSRGVSDLTQGRRCGAAYS